MAFNYKHSFVLTRERFDREEWVLFLPAPFLKWFLDECLLRSYPPDTNARVLLLLKSSTTETNDSDQRFTRTKFYFVLNSTKSSNDARAKCRHLDFDRPYRFILRVTKRYINTVVELRSRDEWSRGGYWQRFCPQFKSFLPKSTCDFLDCFITKHLFENYRRKLFSDFLQNERTIRPPVTLHRVMERDVVFYLYRRVWPRFTFRN